jgi:hypothetical protein
MRRETKGVALCREQGGPRLLISYVIKQAVEDYQMMTARGFVSRGQIVPGAMRRFIMCKPWRRQHAGRFFQTEQDVWQLIEFLKHDVDVLIDVAGLRVNPKVMRETLGLTP